MKSAGIILTVLVLVAVPLGVLVVARNTAPHAHHLTTAAIANQFKAQLRREGASDIQCSRTGQHGSYGVMCTGQRHGSSSTTLYELAAEP
jgi:hypothetical protein